MDDFPREIIGVIVSFLPSKDAIFLMAVSKHWMISIRMFYHNVDIDNIDHPAEFAKIMNMMNYLNSLKIDKCKKLEEGNLLFLEKSKTTLVRLSISNHSIGSISVKDFTSLEKLKVCNSKSIHTVILENLPNLQSLNLSRTRIINPTKTMSFLNEKSKLRKLNLSGCNNISNDFYLTEECKSLIHLDISGTMIYKNVLEELLKQCPSVKMLNTSRCNYLKNLVIRDHQSCETLNMSFCRGMYHLRILGNSSLKYLNLSKNSVYGRFLVDILRSNPNLIEVDFSSCYNFNELVSGFEVGKVLLPNLTVLDCNYTAIGDDHIRVLMGVCVNLKVFLFRQSHITNLIDCGSATIEKIDMSGTSVTNVGVNNLIENCPMLKDLNIATCQSIRDEFLDFEPAKSLEILDLTNTVMSEKIITKVEACKKLRKLFLCRIRIENFKENIVFENWNCLEELDLSGNNRITTLEISNCPKLRSLNISSLFLMEKLKLQNLENLEIVKLEYCRIAICEYVMKNYKDVDIEGKDRNYEKTTTYQQDMFLRCVERNKKFEKNE